MTHEHIEQNKTETLKAGDRVVMHSCGEAEFDKFKGKIWDCKTNSFMGYGGQELVFLEGFSGSFLVKYLQIVNIEESQKGGPDKITSYHWDTFTGRVSKVKRKSEGGPK